MIKTFGTLPSIFFNYRNKRFNSWNIEPNFTQGHLCAKELYPHNLAQIDYESLFLFLVFRVMWKWKKKTHGGM